jgi:hypothetical protein
MLMPIRIAVGLFSGGFFAPEILGLPASGIGKASSPDRALRNPGQSGLRLSTCFKFCVSFILDRSYPYAPTHLLTIKSHLIIGIELSAGG